MQRDRKERQRAEAERAERGKAEREKAAQERKAARAKAAAERAKAFTVVFGTSAGSTAYSGAGAARSGSGKQQRDASRQSMDSTGASDGDRQAAPAGDAGTAGSATPRPKASDSSSGTAGFATPVKVWGQNRQQQEQRRGSGSGGKQGKAAAARGSAAGQSKAAAAAVAAASPACMQADSGRPVVAVAHARCDSFEILGDEHSKLGLDMLALLESPEDSSAPNSTTAASQQQQQLRASRSLDAAALFAAHQASQQQVQSVQGGATSDSQHGSEAASQHPGSHPATPRFNLVDLGGASWGVEASDGLAQLNQSVRPASAGGCIMSLSPGSAAAARATAAMDSAARQSLDLQISSSSSSGQPNIWRSPLGLGIEGPGALPPLAPRGQHQPLRHAAAQGVRCAMDDSILGNGIPQQQLGLSHGANSFDPVTSPAGKISPVGTAVTTLGTGSVPEPAFMYRHGFGGSSSMGMSSPRSYPQLQQAHPSLLQHQLAAHSRSMGGGAGLLSSLDDGSATQTAAAISSMGGAGQPLWLGTHMLQQQALAEQQQQQAAAGLLGSAALMQHAGASGFPSLSQPLLAVSDALQMQYEQHLLQQQLQQYPQQAMGNAALTAGGLLQPPLSAPMAAPAIAALGACASPASLGAQGGVGALSGSFAFGAPYSSSFSPAPLRGSSSLGGAAAAADGVLARRGSGGLQMQGSGSVLGEGGGGENEQGTGASGMRGSGGVSRPELLLPDDLNFSPPSAGPARWLQE